MTCTAQKNATYACSHLHRSFILPVGCGTYFRACLLAACLAIGATQPNMAVGGLVCYTSTVVAGTVGVRCSTLRLTKNLTNGMDTFEVEQDLYLHDASPDLGHHTSSDVSQPLLLLTAPERSFAHICHRRPRQSDVNANSSCSECEHRWCGALRVEGGMLTKGVEGVAMTIDASTEIDVTLTPLGGQKSLICRTTTTISACRVLASVGTKLELGEEVVIRVGLSRHLTVAPLGVDKAVVCYEAFSHPTESHVAILTCTVLTAKGTVLVLGEAPLRVRPPCQVLDCHTPDPYGWTPNFQSGKVSSSSPRVHYEVVVGALAPMKSVLCYAVYGSCPNCLGHGVCEIVREDTTALRSTHVLLPTQNVGLKNLVLAPLSPSAALFCYIATDRIVCNMLSVHGQYFRSGDDLEVAKGSVTHLALRPIRADLAMLCYIEQIQDAQSQSHAMCGTLRVLPQRLATSFMPVSKFQTFVALTHLMLPAAAGLSIGFSEAPNEKENNTIQLGRLHDSSAPLATDSGGPSLLRIIVIAFALVVASLFAIRCIYRICFLYCCNSCATEKVGSAYSRDNYHLTDMPTRSPKSTPNTFSGGANLSSPARHSDLPKLLGNNSKHSSDRRDAHDRNPKEVGNARWIVLDP